MINIRQVLAAYRTNESFTIGEAEAIILSLLNTINWVSVSERLPTRMDEDYWVCVRNKNKEGGIPIQDIANFSSDGIWIKQNTWEDVVYWSEQPKSPKLI